MGARRKITGALLAGIMALASLPAPALPARPEAEGLRPLSEILDELEKQGLQLLYSSALVTEDMQVPAGSAAESDPRAALQAVLLPLGLEARPGPGNTLLIVRRPDRPPRSSPHRLAGYQEEVVVTAGTDALRNDQSTARLELDEGETRVAPAEGGALNRVLESLPGLASADSSAAFSIRGSRSRDVALILDGLELYEPFHLQGFQSPFSYIDSDLVERMDVLGGGLTADSGDRHGGFVRLSTFSRPPENRTSVELGTLNSRVSHTTNVPGGTLLVAARAWYPDSLEHSIEIGEDVNPRFQDAYAKYTLHLSPRTILSAHALLARDKLDFVEPFGGNESVEATGKSAHTWVRALHAWSDSLFSETVISMGHIARSRRGFAEPEDVLLRVDDTRRTDFYGVRHDLTLNLSPRHVLRTGIDTRLQQGEYRYVNGPAADPDVLGLKPRGQSWGVHLAHRASWGSRLVTEIGLRWDRQSHTGDQQYSPRFNSTFALGERSRLRFGFGDHYQSQRIHELRIEDGETSFSPAEHSRQTALTFEHDLVSGASLTVGVYDRRLKSVQPRYENLFNPVELFPETEFDRVRVAPDRAHLQGVELSLRGARDRRFHWRVGYTLSSARNIIAGHEVARSWDQPHAGSFALGYQLGRRWGLALSGTAHTGWPTTPVRIESVENAGQTTFVAVPGERNSDRFSDYARLDLQVQHFIPLDGGRLVFTLGITNLTDRDNICCVNEVFIGTGADGQPGAQRLLNTWPGITPSFSVRWEF